MKALVVDEIRELADVLVRRPGKRRTETARARATHDARVRWRRKPTFIAAMVPLVLGSRALAQRAPDDTTKTFFVKRDLAWSAAALAGTGIVSVFDKRIARWTQSSSVQGSSSRHRLVSALTKINETTLTGAAILGYGIGRLAHSSTMADVGLHTAESTILTSLISQAIRGPLGRERPSISPDDQYRFRGGKGFTSFNNRSFPSLHSATGFAAATALSAEIHERNPGASWWVTPVAYTVAMVPGLTRMYLNQHWASDVVAGAFVGGLMGNRVVHYAHTHRRTKLDRALLGSTLAPDGRGRVTFGASFEW